MAHFYGTVQGGRGEASRLGHKSSGMLTRCNSYTIGATSVLQVSNTDGEEFDELSVSITRGSNSSGDLGYFNARMVGRELRISPDEHFMAAISPPIIGALLSRIDDPAMIEWVSGLIIKNPAWAKHLRAKLWIEGEAYEPVP